MSDEHHGHTIQMRQAIKRARDAGRTVECAQCGAPLGGDIMVSENGPMHPKCWQDMMGDDGQ